MTFATCYLVLQAFYYKVRNIRSFIYHYYFMPCYKFCEADSFHKYLKSHKNGFSQEFWSCLIVKKCAILSVFNTTEEVQQNDFCFVEVDIGE